jgi:gluconokinase
MTEYAVPVPARLIVMGVAGCGKSTVGALLARRLGAIFVDGDDHHPPANVAKMASGAPLTDDDRWPWLDRLGEVMEETVRRQGRVVLACSALRRAYRNRLSAGCAVPPLFVHLSGERELIASRMAARRAHFMPPALLDSQIATLEPIEAGENAIVIRIDTQPADVVAGILEQMGAA